MWVLYAPNSAKPHRRQVGLARFAVFRPSGGPGWFNDDPVVAVLAASAAFALASTSAAGAVTPIRGSYSGATAAGQPFSMVIKSKKAGSRLRPKFKRISSVGDVMAAVPVSCNSGENRNEPVGFPGPLHVGRKGRFGVTGIAQSNDGDRVTTKVAGRFTGRRRVSGTLSYRGGFGGEFCSGAITWTARHT